MNYTMFDQSFNGKVITTLHFTNHLHFMMWLSHPFYECVENRGDKKSYTQTKLFHSGKKIFNAVQENGFFAIWI